MNGPEHYREAERLLKPRNRYSNGVQTRVDPPTELDVARASVHTQLAALAFQVDTAFTSDVVRGQEWEKVVK